MLNHELKIEQREKLCMMFTLSKERKIGPAPYYS